VHQQRAHTSSVFEIDLIWPNIGTAQPPRHKVVPVRSVGCDQRCFQIMSLSDGFSCTSTIRLRLATASQLPPNTGPFPSFASDA
jgi:hypothetical protein